MIRGKLPIAEFVYAHALTDNLKKIIYGLANNVIDGLFCDPYEGFYKLGAIPIIFAIVKRIINSYSTLIFIMIVPPWYYGKIRGQSTDRGFVTNLFDIYMDDVFLYMIKKTNHQEESGRGVLILIGTACVSL